MGLGSFIPGGDPTRFGPLRRLFRETLSAHWRSYCLALLMMVAVAGSTAALAWVTRDLVDGVFTNRDLDGAIIFSMKVFAIFLVRGSATFASNVMMARIGNAVVTSFQTRIFRQLLTQSVGFFEGTTSADLVTRVLHYAQAARDMVQLVVMTLGRDLITVIGLVAVMLFSDWRMFLAAIVVMPLAVIGVDRLRQKVRKLSQGEISAMTEMTALVQETVQGIRIVKSFGLEADMTQRLERKVQSLRTRADRIAALAARSSPIMEVVGGIAISAAITYGAWRVMHAGGNQGSFFAFVTALFLAYEPAKRLARLGIEIEKGMAGIRSVYDLIDAPPAMVDAPNAQPLQVSEGTVAFEAVSFGYRDGQNVFDALSFAAQGRKMTALVGPSGGGKSTIIALAQRFYDPASGAVTIDGQDLRRVTVASLRESISFVSQDVFLFRGTIAENIAVGRRGADRAAIIEAAKAAFAHDFIEALPDGYETTIGEFGAGLSGGQRQRVAIARAILRDAPIMLLDEATSALDSESEQAVQRALETLMQGRTSIVIAHRLSTIMRADMILVVEGGMVVESGTHDALIARGGRYADYVAIQQGN